jgi:hypothetical protein
MGETNRFNMTDSATSVVERAKPLGFLASLANLFSLVGGFAASRIRMVKLRVLTLVTLVRFGVGGIYKVECFDSFGRLKWTTFAKNGVTDVGIASVLNIYLRAQTQITAWYIGLIDNAGFTALASSDTMASHVGWSEVAGANYSDANRIAWSAGAPSGGAVVNATSSDFHMINGSALTVRGLFLISDNTKGGTTGTLFSTAAFTGGNQTVNNGDTLKVTYTVSATSA